MSIFDGHGDARPILGEAMAVAERVEDGKARVEARNQIGLSMQRIGLEAEFGSYATDATSAFNTQYRERFPRDPELEAQWQARSARLRELESEAKRLFLTGDLSAAQDVYISADDLRDDHLRWGLLGAQIFFLNWRLEAGEIDGALEFFKSMDWSAPFTHVRNARKIAEAFIAAGDRPKGLDVLRETRPDGNAPKAYETLSWLGQELWFLGEADEGKAVLREAAQASLVAAQRDGHLPLWGYSSCEPIAIAQIQVAISDREGAVETLEGVLRLVSPIDYDPAPPPPADMPPRYLWIAARTLKPTASRWLEAQPHLARILACAGLDAKAFQFLKTPELKQLDLLANIVAGQARRGAFETAFRTLERMRTEPLTTPSEPSQITLRPTGEVSVFTQSKPTRPVEETERKAALRSGVWSILKHAALLGDIAAYKRADELWKPIAEPHRGPIRNLDELRMFAKAGQADFALELARAIPDLINRVSALLKVAEGIAGIEDQRGQSFYS